MNNKTFETLQKTVFRLDAILEVDHTLKVYEREALEDVVDVIRFMVEENENSVKSNAEEIRT